MMNNSKIKWVLCATALSSILVAHPEIGFAASFNNKDSFNKKISSYDTSTLQLKATSELNLNPSESITEEQREKIRDEKLLQNSESRSKVLKEITAKVQQLDAQLKDMVSKYDEIVKINPNPNNNNTQPNTSLPNTSLPNTSLPNTSLPNTDNANKTEKPTKENPKEFNDSKHEPNAAINFPSNTSFNTSFNDLSNKPNKDINIDAEKNNKTITLVQPNITENTKQENIPNKKEYKENYVNKELKKEPDSFNILIWDDEAKIKIAVGLMALFLTSGLILFFTRKSSLKSLIKRIFFYKKNKNTENLSRFNILKRKVATSKSINNNDYTFSKTPSKYLVDSDTTTASSQPPSDSISQQIANQIANKMTVTNNEFLFEEETSDTILETASAYYDSGELGHAISFLRSAIEARPEEMAIWIKLFELYKTENMGRRYLSLANKFRICFKDNAIIDDIDEQCEVYKVQEKIGLIK